jgi:ribosome-associated heat shock protein Hsp15
MQESKRIDKWLWEVRVFKTRSQATLACKSGKVKVGDQVVKPSRELNKEDRITVNQAPVTRTIKVVDFPKSRIGAKLLPDYMEDLTSDEEYQKLRMIKQMNFEYRDRGIGRPTKRQRRDLEELKKQWKEE